MCVFFKRKIVLKPFSCFFHKCRFDIFAEWQKGKEHVLCFVDRNLIAKVNDQFSRKKSLGSNMECLFSVMFKKVEIVEFIPNEKSFFNQDTLTTDAIVKRSGRDAGKCK